MTVSQRLIRAFVRALLVFCFACASANVVATRSPCPVTPITRVYVMIEQRTFEASFTRALGAALCREFETQGVAANFRALNGLSSDERDAFEQARQWQADARLTLDFAGGMASVTSFSTVVFSADLFHRGAPKPVWHARVQSEEGSFGSTQGMIDDAARSLVDRLQSDGWLDVRHRT